MTRKETPKTPPRGAKRNPALPETPLDHPTLPGIEPVKPAPIFDPATAEMVERLRQTLEAATARMALPVVPAGPQEFILSPTQVRTIEGRVIERLAPVLMQILTELRAAADIAQALPAQIQEAGQTARVEIIRTGDTARHAARLASVETQRAIEDVNKLGRAQIVRLHRHAQMMHAHALTWTRGLTRHTKHQLQETAKTATGEMSIATAGVQKLANQLGVTASTVEECADAILYVAPALTQHHEVRTRSIVRSGALATTGLTFAGLAAVMGALWWAGVLH